MKGRLRRWLGLFLWAIAAQLLDEKVVLEDYVLDPTPVPEPVDVLQWREAEEV